jgi:hypothetical protein
MQDLASRLAICVQLNTDGHRAYLQAVEDAFGANIDYAMLIKLYGGDNKPDTKYSPDNLQRSVVGTLVKPDLTNSVM